MPRKSTSRKSNRKSIRRKSNRKTTSRKSNHKTTSRKSNHKTTSRKSNRKTTSRKSNRKTIKRKSNRKTTSILSTSSSSGEKKNEYVFSVWYVNKPNVNNKFTVKEAKVKLDDDNEWLFTGFIEAESKEKAKSWLRSLGSVKKYSGTSQERIEI
jgi:hypothetical protein